MSRGKMLKKYGPWAVITGGTGGIGAEFVNQLVDEGFNVVLVARNEKQLDKKAVEIKKNFGVQVKTIAADLSQEDGIQRVFDGTRNLDIGLVVPNAGMENNGPFTGVDYQRGLLEIQLNVTAVYKLTHHFASRLERRGKGGIVLVASMLGHMATPYFANYSGTKAYVINLGASLNGELKKKGVDITVLSPGLTNTAMAKSVKSKYNLPMPTMSPEFTAKVALKALGRKPLVIPGIINNTMYVMMTRLMSVKASIMGAKIMMETSMIK